MVPTAATLLSAWEAGVAEAPLARAPSLLARLGAIPSDQNVEEMTVGQCDARLFELRRQLFGDMIEALATCPGCGDEVELSLSVAQLQPPILDLPQAEVTLEQSDYAVVFRIPRNDDLRRLGANGLEAAIGELVENCVVAARRVDGQAVAASELPDDLVAAIVDAMVASDPGAQTALTIRCGCGAEWDEELHIRSVLWTDLTDWVARTLTEVQEVAGMFGWSEAEILSMPAWRRRWYLEATG